MHRTGTTSVGRFFRDFGFRWAGWPADERNGWSQSWVDGNFEKIFSSPDFINANAYEDCPWFYPNFYKYLYHRFPGSKFILFTRNPNLWFESLYRLNSGRVGGDPRVHSKLYRREEDFFRGKLSRIDGMADRYKKIYRLHAIEVVDFFKRYEPSALFVGQLEDPEKWKKLGKFLGVGVPSGYDSHENRSA